MFTAGEGVLSGTTPILLELSMELHQEEAK
jgi:hypothetical protein